MTTQVTAGWGGGGDFPVPDGHILDYIRCRRSRHTGWRLVWLQILEGKPNQLFSPDGFVLKWRLSLFVDFCPRTIIMATHNPARVVLMFVGLVTFLVAITFNSLSGFGAKSGEYLSFQPARGFVQHVMENVNGCAYLCAGVFRQSTEEVTLKYLTPITPAPWALFVWDYIYIWILAMFLYFLVGLCRRLAPAPFVMLSHIIYTRLCLISVSHSMTVSLFFLLLSPPFALLHANKSVHLVWGQFRIFSLHVADYLT